MKSFGVITYGSYTAYTLTSTPLPIPDDVSMSAVFMAKRFTWTNSHVMTAVQVYYATSNDKKTKWSVMTFKTPNFDLREDKLVKGKTYYYKYRYVYYNGTLNYGPFSSVETFVN